MSIKKKIKRKRNRIKEAKKAGLIPSSTSKVVQNASTSCRKRPVKLRVMVVDPTPGKLNMDLERARLEGIRTGLEVSAMGMFVRAIGGFVSGLNSCPKCDKPLPSGRYSIKCKCGYCKIGNTRELNSDLLFTGIAAAAFGAIASLIAMNELKSISKDKSKPTSLTIGEYKDPFGFDSIFGKKEDKDNVISISVDSNKKSTSDDENN